MSQVDELLGVSCQCNWQNFWRSAFRVRFKARKFIFLHHVSWELRTSYRVERRTHTFGDWISPILRWQGVHWSSDWERFIMSDQSAADASPPLHMRKETAPVRARCVLFWMQDNLLLHATQMLGNVYSFITCLVNFCNEHCRRHPSSAISCFHDGDDLGCSRLVYATV